MNNTDLILINPYCPEAGKTERLEKIISSSLQGLKYKTITTVDEMMETDLKGRRLLFSISLGKSGINLSWYQMEKYLRLNQNALENSVGGVILDGDCELYTKSTGRNMVLTANRAGCTFPGRPLVEGTRTLKNYNIQAQNLHTDNIGAYMAAGKTLVENILAYDKPQLTKPKILAIHSSNHETSNSLSLWKMIRSNLNECEINEISLRNGYITDCRGCEYETCLHFGEKGNCFYGGPIVEQVYPAILDCDALVMVCPNYNDALSGNLTAFINRLTALFMTHKFYDKSLFGVVVSGYSGGDIVAEQLISGLNMNKTFALPGKFVILETANSPNEIFTVDGIEDRAKKFAENIKHRLMVKGWKYD